MNANVEMPRTMYFSYHLYFFVKARWLFISGAVVVLLIAKNIINMDLPFNELFITLGIVLLYNIFFWLYMRKTNFHENQCCKSEEGIQGWKQATRLARAQIVFDLAALFFLLHFSGGVENPFIVFFVLHMVAATILLERTGVMLIAMLITGMICSLGFFEHMGILKHHHLGNFYGDFEPLKSILFVTGVSVVISAMNICLSLLVYFMMKEIRRHRDTIVLLSEDLAKKNERLLKMDARRKQTMAIASHDLKSPIDAVSSYLNMMEAGYAGDLTEKQLGIITKSISRLKKLREFISDVLDWQTIERGELRQVMKIENVENILSDVVDDYKDTAVRKNITLNYLPADNLPDIMVSKNRLAQVFDNLISNAVKYTDDNGEVTVKTNAGRDGVEIIISDNGIGLSDDDISHLFEDFYRSPRVKKSYDGTGLGLSVVKRIVDAHHGNITAKSEINKGTTFTVTLPFTNEKESK
ncbi:MAG: HAMP domain-containing histidine kinase [Deltaproteobacteria bacterium]|nr:HAMP domain-containing histidine kinase [Deltaproteobacteria bacterium]